jgi:hypothetical protein
MHFDHLKCRVAEWSPQAYVKGYHTVTDGREAIMQNWLEGKGQNNLLQCHVVKNNLIGSLFGAKINANSQTSGSCAKPTTVLV